MATADFPRDAISAPENYSPDAATRLARNLERLAARRNTLRMVQAIVRALVPGVALAATGILAYRFYLIDGEAWMPIAIIIAALAVGYRNGLMQKRGSFAAALDADRALDLNDRLSSALAFAQPHAVQRVRTTNTKTDVLSRIQSTLFPRLEMQTAHAGATTSMVPALVHDAAARSEQLDAKVLYPTKFDRPLQILCGLSILLLGFMLMPDNGYFLSPEQKKLTATLKAEGVKLQEIAKEVRKKPEAQQSEDTKKLSKKLEDLGRKMQRGRMSKRGALLGLGELKKDLQKASANDRKSPSSDMARMEEALKNENFETPEAQQMQQELQKGDFGKAAQQLEKLADKMEKGELSQKEREQAANDLEKAAQALRRRGGAENEAAADQLEKAAQQMRQGNQQGQQNQQQQGQNGQQQGKQQGKQQGQQSQNGQQQGQQQGKQQGQQQGQSGQSQSGQQQGQQQNQGNQAGANAMRNMAKGLRQNGSQMGNNQSLRDMMKKIQDAEKQTGSNSGQQSGLGSDGKMCEGPGCEGGDKPGQSTTPGKDLRASDPKSGTAGGAGLGRRDHISGAQQKGGGVSKLRSTRTGDERRWGDVWSDRLPKTRSKIDRITGKMGGDGDVEQLPTKTEAKDAPVNTPYYDVYESYKKDAEDAISKEAVPPAYKAPVKEYFESLKP